jgi:predicted DNA-binding protein with PD1-like motif
MNLSIQGQRQHHRKLAMNADTGQGKANNGRVLITNMKHTTAQQPVGTRDNGYLSPAAPLATGKAPGMKVKLLADNLGVRSYVIIFSKGDEVLSGITDFASQYKVTSASFTAVGALEDAITAWFDLKKRMYKLNRIKQQVELISLIGAIGLYNDKPLVHTHFSVGLPDGTVRGGHLIEAHVCPTVELFVTVYPTPLRKQLDDETQLKLFHPELE